MARQMQRVASNSRRKRDVEDVGSREEIRRWTDSDDENNDKGTGEMESEHDPYAMES